MGRQVIGLPGHPCHENFRRGVGVRLLGLRASHCGGALADPLILMSLTWAFHVLRILSGTPVSDHRDTAAALGVLARHGLSRTCFFFGASASQLLPPPHSVAVPVACRRHHPFAVY